jgi:hypothetical protein
MAEGMKGIAEWLMPEKTVYRRGEPPIFEP